jgi:hypothetical protein
MKWYKSETLNYVYIKLAYENKQQWHVKYMIKVGLPIDLARNGNVPKSLHKIFKLLNLKESISSNKKTGNIRTNVTSRHMRLTFVDMEKQQVLHILSVCM